MVWIMFLDQHVTVEAAHFGNGEDTDAAERACRDVEHLTLSDVSTELTLAVALQTIERDLTGSNVTFKGATREVGRAAILQQTVLNELELDGTVGAHLAGRRVATVEAHKRIRETILVAVLLHDVLIVDILRCRVVDVEQRHCISAGAQADILRQGTVDVYLAGHGDTARYQTGVDVARLKSEFLGESGPALVGKSHILA